MQQDMITDQMKRIMEQREEIIKLQNAEIRGRVLRRKYQREKNTALRKGKKKYKVTVTGKCKANKGKEAIVVKCRNCIS